MTIAQSSDSLTIYVLDELVYLPTAFSPNGDGNNDGFRPIVVDDNIDFDSWEFSIYNRWGELVFKTNDVNEAWDGTYNGEVLYQYIHGIPPTAMLTNKKSKIKR